MSAAGSDPTIAWLLRGDPAIRWQALRDLTGAAPGLVSREKRRVAEEGWGARLLQRQDPQGTWGGGLYTPKWISTTYTMLLLRDLGLPPRHRRAKTACRLLLDHGLRSDGGIDYSGGRLRARAATSQPGQKRRGRSETCITGIVLSILATFEFDDQRLDTLVENLLDEQMPDGGWNCDRRRGATHASMHTTILALEGLSAYRRFRRRKARAVEAAERAGREFLLVHRLFRSHRTGEIIKPSFVRASFPPRWHYDFLRALDYFQAVRAPRDRRLEGAISLLRQSCRPDGRWTLQNSFGQGRVFFAMEANGRPSRWNTLRALRVLRWWEARN